MVQNRNNLVLDIIEVLMAGRVHLRGIAKALGESHSTVQRKLSKLCKDNIVDFQREGKNKIFFLKDNVISRAFILQAELNKSVKTIKQYPQLSIIFEQILKRTDERLIILFGSYAKGMAKKTSDIDIYIETKDRNLKKSIEYIHSRVNVKIGPFDTKSPLIREIIDNHVIIRGVEEYYEKQLSQQAQEGGKVRVS